MKQVTLYVITSGLQQLILHGHNTIFILLPKLLFQPIF